MTQRIIKFRIWDGKKFGYWTPNTGLGEVAGWPKIEGEVQQFTGLTDKNGKEIYEGDVVRCFDNGRECGVGEVKFGRFDSSHEAGYSRYHYHHGFFIENNGEQVRDCVNEDIDWKDTEVIGNVHENPELLTK